MAAKEIPIAGYGPRLLGRFDIAEGTMAFHFEKPPDFYFKPGQSADLTLSNPPETDAEGNTRTFSIASPSFENQLIFATRLINQEMLSRHLTSLQGPIYYVSGPRAMVAGMRQVLLSANVDEDDIRTEDFAGY